jgi:hypothetical protein
MLFLVFLLLLVAIFAKQICQLNAAWISIMPAPLQRFYRWQYWGRSPDDPIWVTVLRVLALSVAGVVLIMVYAHRE